MRAIPLMFVSFAMVRGQLLGVGHLSRDAARWALKSLARPSFGRSVRRGASEVNPSLSCCTQRAWEVAIGPGIWQQRRLPVPSPASADHDPWFSGRVAPSRGPSRDRRRLSMRITFDGRNRAKRTLRIFPRNRTDPRKTSGSRLIFCARFGF